MRLPTHLARSLCLLVACLLPPLASAAKQTVCTITINSADEQKTFRRFLPADKYQFVELVERDRPDWLASACQAKVACDMLLISGHHGEGNVFFSDALELDEYLPIAELERVTCSDSCPNLFANLKEVYLFGCDTLNPLPQHGVSAEIARSFVREGSSPGDAARLAKLLGSERGESSRDRMRLVFKGVPVIYGFSSAAPLGPAAASSLSRFFQTAGPGEIGKGRASSGLLRRFAPQGLVATRGMTAGDPLTAMRQDVCTSPMTGCRSRKGWIPSIRSCEGRLRNPACCSTGSSGSRRRSMMASGSSPRLHRRSRGSRATRIPASAISLSRATPMSLKHGRA